MSTWLVSYDVADDRRRRRVAALLKTCGRPLQWSVFACENLSPRKLVQLRQALVAEIDSQQDSIRWYPLCARCRIRLICLGYGDMAFDEPYILL